MTTYSSKTYHEKAFGCLAGVAIGDALGMPTSFLPPQQIRAQFGVIEDFAAPAADHIYHAGLQAGQVTDDTEQTIAVIQALIEAGGTVRPETIVRHLLRWVEKVGGTTSSALGPSSKRAFERIQEGVPLAEAGRWGDTNGAAMRITPIGILHATRPRDYGSIVDDVATACMPTHYTDQAISGAAAIACAVAECFNDKATVESVTQVALAGASEGSKRGHAVIGPSVARRLEWALDLIARAKAVDQAVRDIYELVGAGVATAEAIPAAVALFSLAQGEPRQGMLLAANMGGDCDTVASMVGGMCGAFSGIQAIPPRWLEVVEEVNRLQLAELANTMVQLSMR